MVNYKVVINSNRKLLAVNFKEIWQYRELFLIFVWRDLKVRYKQTFFGAAWVIFQPVASTIIFTYFFGRLAKIPSGDLPYSLFVFCGLVFWNFFSNALSHSSNSLIENEGIVKKVYFPRLILPVSCIITGFVDFVINLILLLAVMLFYGYRPLAITLIVLPIGIIATIVTSIGLGLFLSSFNVKYRDVRYILPFFIQILMFLTPVIYPTSMVRYSNRLLMAVNPMGGVIESARVVLSGGTNVDWLFIVISCVSSVLIFVLGLIYFRLTEKFFADIV